MFTIESLYKSAVKKIQIIKDEILAKGVSTDMGYHAWDSRGEVTELPNADLIGLIGWSYSDNEGLPVVQLGILVSLTGDLNGFREAKILDIIRNHFVGINGDYKTVPLITADAGVEYGVMQVSDFEIMPAGRSEIRTTRNIGVELIRSHGD